MDMLRIKLGNRWAYRYRGQILSTVLEVYPSLAVAEADIPHQMTHSVSLIDTYQEMIMAMLRWECDVVNGSPANFEAR